MRVLHLFFGNKWNFTSDLLGCNNGGGGGFFSWNPPIPLLHPKTYQVNSNRQIL